MIWHARSAWWLYTKSYARRKPHALASTPATPKEKHPFLFQEKIHGWFSTAKFHSGVFIVPSSHLFSKRKGCFFRCFALKDSGGRGFRNFGEKKEKIAQE